MKSIYSQSLAKLIRDQKEGVKPKILFFMGFNNTFFEELMKSEIVHFEKKTSSKLFFDAKSYDARSLAKAFVANQDLSWGFYEEYIILKEAFADWDIFETVPIVVKNNLFQRMYPINIGISSIETTKEFSDVMLNDSIYQKFYSDFEIIKGHTFLSYILKHRDIDQKNVIKEIDFFPESNYAIDEKFDKSISVNDLDDFKREITEGNLPEKDINIIGTLNIKDLPSIRVLSAILNSRQIRLSNFVESEIERSDPNRHLALFREYWGSDAQFRDIKIYKEPALGSETFDLSQGSMVNDIIEQCENAHIKKSNYFDVIITAPTGAGKSLFFQLPAIFLHRKYKMITLVITPLIALMNDQVNELYSDRGIDFATFINSEITYEQRSERIRKIQEGYFSIVYISPESLLSSDVHSIIGNREIGLFVVDEAHLVTSWGRDFRVDYWFLGDFIEKTRKGSYYRGQDYTMQFPVLCLTATAVYGGNDDVIQDLSNSLNLNINSSHQYIGNVRRDEIKFGINRYKKTRFRNSLKEEKSYVTALRIAEFYKEKKKAIVYLPFVSQISPVYKELSNIPEVNSRKVLRYTGSGMDKFEKNDAYISFRDNKDAIMLATKAFGMGVNIPDIHTVYHFAPTGTLSDYVQEIGRAARKLPEGRAIIDYYNNDTRYASQLWGLSGLRQYQLHQIIKKIYTLYEVNQKRNFLVAPEVFGFLFDNEVLDNKVKSGLMLISNDLLEKYQFKVLIVRPKNMFTTQFIMIPDEIKDEFKAIYGKYLKLVCSERETKKVDKHYIEELYSNPGDVYEIELSKVWEEKFPEKTFAQFKYKFFNNELHTNGKLKVFPRYKLVIHYKDDFDVVKQDFLSIAKSIQSTFNKLYDKFANNEFSFEDFYGLFKSETTVSLKQEVARILLDIFCFEQNFSNIVEGDVIKEEWKFIKKSQRDTGSTGLRSTTAYAFRKAKRSFIEDNLKRYFYTCNPDEQNKFVKYLPVPKKDSTRHMEYQLVASLLEIFDLATYEMIGGKNPQIFIRVNDPQKLSAISKAKEYRNTILSRIEKHHKRSAMIIDRFMSIELSNQNRWDLIEKYFLGFDGEVDRVLEIDVQE
jgi:ATP-dependent DNA helicase RecQ